MSRWCDRAGPTLLTPCGYSLFTAAQFFAHFGTAAVAEPQTHENTTATRTSRAATLLSIPRARPTVYPQSRRSAPAGAPLADHGHPRPKFLRALETGSLILAELGARECGQLTLDEALQLTALVALHDRDRGERYALRWLSR